MPTDNAASVVAEGNNSDNEALLRHEPEAITVSL